MMYTISYWQLADKYAFVSDFFSFMTFMTFKILYDADSVTQVSVTADGVEKKNLPSTEQAGKTTPKQVFFFLYFFFFFFFFFSVVDRLSIV